MDDFVHWTRPPGPTNIDWVPIRVDIYAVAQDDLVTYEDVGIFDVAAQEVDTSIWAEGNFSCDCNRADFFAEAQQLPDDEEAPCGDTRYRVRLASLTGRVIYDEITPWLAEPHQSSPGGNRHSLPKPGTTPQSSPPEE